MLANKARDGTRTGTTIKEQDAVPIVPDQRSSTAPHVFSPVLHRFNKLKPDFDGTISKIVLIQRLVAPAPVWR